MARPSIPDPVKREVRQRCGFGCVICGLPLYEYDHLIPYSAEQVHTAENLVLLCDQHHREKTKGLLSLEVVLEAAREPRNLRTGQSHPFSLHFQGSGGETIIGSNRHSWPLLRDGDFGIPLLVDDVPLVVFRVEDEHLLLTVQLFDRDNNLLVRIVDNELVYSIDPWDVEFVGRRLTVRHGPSDIFVRMVLDPPSRVTINRGKLWRNGCEVKVSPQHLVLPGENVVAGSVFRCSIGIAIGDPPEGLSVGILMSGLPREPYEDDRSAEITRLRATST